MTITTNKLPNGTNKRNGIELLVYKHGEVT